MAYFSDPSAVAAFDNLESAERTIDQLREKGFSANEIGIIGHIGQDKNVPAPAEVQRPEENAMGGFLRGALLGAVVGILVVLIIPGLSAIAGQGRWFEVVGGAILGAAICGVLVAFNSFVFNRPKTRLYVSELEKGRFLVTVNSPARREEAVSLLRQQGHVE